MSVKEQIKSTGATFTPKELANFLAIEITKYVNPSHSLSVLDPSCGDGELLLAIKNIFRERNIDFSLNGYDTNEIYLDKAASRLDSLGIEKVSLNQGDFLEMVDLSENQLEISFQERKKNERANSSADVIIANPPYVRTQILGTESAQKLAQKFNLKGRVDLYYPFLIAMTESLKKGGVLGVITSNRYLSTKGGESIRKYLADNYSILELIDLGDTKLFDAAVLPAIFIGRKKDNSRLNPNKAKFIKIYEELNGYNGELINAENIYDILRNNKSGYFTIGKKNYKKTNGLLKYEVHSGSPWQMFSKEETIWVDQIQKSSCSFIGDHFKVKVGIKTTADKVFISKKWNELGDNKPEDELLRDLISQENIEKWSANDSVNLKVLYTHYVENGKRKIIDLEQYPLAEKYFLSHETQLKGRKYVINAGRNWYEIWVPHNPIFWEMPKLVFPDISISPRFYFDQEGKIVNGNCYWIVAQNIEEQDRLLLIQGIANSKLMTKYHDLVFNNKLYSGRRRYFSQFVEKYPLPNLQSVEAKEIISVVKLLNQTTFNEKVKPLELKLEKLVAKAFGVSPVFNLD